MVAGHVVVDGLCVVAIIVRVTANVKIHLRDRKPPSNEIFFSCLDSISIEIAPTQIAQKLYFAMYGAKWAIFVLLIRCPAEQESWKRNPKNPWCFWFLLHILSLKKIKTENIVEKISRHFEENVFQHLNIVWLQKFYFQFIFCWNMKSIVVMKDEMGLWAARWHFVVIDKRLVKLWY